MKAWSVYRRADGVLTGVTVRGSHRAAVLNTPAGCAFVEGEFDQYAWRIDVETGQPVAHVSEPPTPSEDDQWREVRATRQMLLASSDWTELAGAADRIGAERFAAWQGYRQALRDITEQTLPVVWPVAPE